MRVLKSNELTSSAVNLQIHATDALGLGGACHNYEIWRLGRGEQPAGAPLVPCEKLADFKFQNGGIQEVGVNGVTHEALLAVVIDRLEQFQAGSYPSLHNDQALLFAKLALNALHQRTAERMKRGVEGQVKA